MGAGGSVPTVPTDVRSIEPPPLPPPFITNGQQTTRISGASVDESQDRSTSRSSTVDLGGPQSQGPSPYATLRREEWWHHRPSAPSLPNLQPQQETLLTYAAQMTGWQAAGGPGPSTTTNQDVTELTRTISHLALANQQLSTAHNMALAHLEALYVELRRLRESRKEGASFDLVEEDSKMRLDEDEDKDRRDMRVHIGRLEALIAERSSFFKDQEILQREEERNLRDRVEKLENLLIARNEEILKIKECAQESDKDDEEKIELRRRLEVAEGLLVSKNEVVEDEEKRRMRKKIEYLENLLRNLESSKNSSSRDNGVEASGPVEVQFLVKRQAASSDYEKAMAKIDDLEKQLQTERSKHTSDNFGDDLNHEYQKAVHRIHILEEELDNVKGRSESQTMKEDLERKYDLAVDRMVGLDTKLRQEEDAEESRKSREKIFEKSQNDEIVRLTNEIEKLKTDRFETQEINEKLRHDLELQKETIEKLKEDYEISKTQYEKVELNLNERTEEFKKLQEGFEFAKEETVRLLKELDAFHLEKDTAKARISSLEQDLQKSLLEKEQIKGIESQKCSRLRAQLSEEVSDKKKQIKALEDALEEIQRLKEAVKAEKKDLSPDGNVQVLEPVVEAIETSEEVPEVPEEATSNRASNMEEFKKELTLKREARQRAIAAVSSEMERLRRELDAEKEAHSETSKVLELLKSAQGGPASRSEDSERLDDSGTEEVRRLKEEVRMEKEAHEETLRRMEAQRLADTLKISDELKNNIRLQTEKIDDLQYQLECNHEGHENQISRLKEVNSKSREILKQRERQINKLKDLLAQILARLGDRSFLEISDDVRYEYDQQLDNIRNLKSLYEERLKVLNVLKDSATKELVDVKEKFEIARKKSEGLEEDLKKAEDKIDIQDTEISNLESQLGLTKADCRDLQNQMSVINSLFTQMLLSASSADMDLDRLTRLLQENHDLISDMAREEGTEAAALPKLLLDIVEQVEGRNRAQSSGSEIEKKEEDPQEENIAHNLPKVWRVLLELLSCHAVGAPAVSASSSSAPDSCYKSVDTPTGPRLVISVSKTYIRLKELILEKKHLEKEMNRMKQLNTHLESKLGEQEKRLSMVSDELSKTWNIVGRMQAQHQQLHTHEKILRYELQQKRKMLQELKQELEYCREKWESARQKNTNTEIEWRSLRREFAARKALAAQDSFNNSGESGFSDERGDDSDEEDEAVEERVRISPRRRARKESPRVPTPDTESEQPTDTELSESKTGSSITLEQRTPTPETEAEVDSEIIEVDASDPRPATPEPDCTPDSEPLNPLDRALTNVIQNLIKIDSTSGGSTSSTSRESIAMPSGSCSFRESGSANKSKSVSPKRRNSKRSAREWSPHSEPWTSWMGEFDLSTLGSKKSSKQKESYLERSSSQPPSESTSALDLEVFNAITEPVESSLEIIGQLAAPSTSNFIEVARSSSVIERFDPVTTANLEVFGSNATDQGIVSLEEERAFKPEVTEGDNISIESTSSLETVKEFPVLTPKYEETTTKDPSDNSAKVTVVENVKVEKVENPSTSPPETVASSSATRPNRTPEEVLASRAARLKRLEEQADWLMKKMNATSQRSSALSTRLEELHEVYGEPPAPPPLPNSLPSLRIQTDLEAPKDPPFPPSPPPMPSVLPARRLSTTDYVNDSESPPDNAP
ncbi:227 kDa spindle- and centromere-associated protein isoform X3 [Cephus cinctus]|uniref:227 kDa spindle- and centromere-associated protein isoform X3 n=1 Tax=Cephus cinctus TaxID=211228 RepID=A0AAJ7BMP6_CEPCN|nr:227 kDa spindle- and centromere-associated protein isoform X3 [Cephus cinctus]